MSSQENMNSIRKKKKKTIVVVGGAATAKDLRQEFIGLEDSEVDENAVIIPQEPPPIVERRVQQYEKPGKKPIRFQSSMALHEGAYVRIIMTNGRSFGEDEKNYSKYE